jgi:alpha-beta hydrolase superfamily lysophospholipase
MGDSAFSAPAPAQEVALTASDGIRIAATYWPGKRADAPAALLLHGLGATRSQVAGNATWLADQGFAVLALDFRGHGQSGEAAHAFGLTESRDARAGFDWLKAKQQGAPVGVLGISLGGAAALLGDGGPLPAQAFVLQAVFPDIRDAIRNRFAVLLPMPLASLLEPLLSYQSVPRFHVGPEQMRPVAKIGEIAAPSLIVDGAQDRFTPPAETRQLFDAAPAPKEMLVLEGRDHAQSSFVETPDYREKLRAFFVAALGAP